MRGRVVWVGVWTLFPAVASFAAVAASTAPPAPVTLPARAVRYQPEVRAWAQVHAIAPLVLRARVTAQVAKVLVRPGQAVIAGQPLVALSGLQLEGELSAARARWRAAQRQLVAAQRTFAASKRTYPVVTNRQALDAAEAALAAAQSQSAAAHTAYTTLQAERTLRSPIAARVDAVESAAGSDVAAGAPLLALVVTGSLWLRAEVFGNQPSPTMTAARFVPAGGGPAIPVRCVAELPARAPDGARVFNFAPVGAAAWQPGETGEVVWPERPRTAIAVPAGALVLNAGRWYVLTDVHDKLIAQAVTPGPARGTDVLITRGLRPGEPVVVRQAYLLFHRHFAAHYAPLD